MLLRLALAALFGGVLGFERELKQKEAGLRTHMMVALGAACFTLAAFVLVDEAVGRQHDQTLRVDPVRIVEAIAGGIGFLGAGVILREAGSVHGLTTAGSLWLSGAVGMAAGTGRYLLAGEATLLALFVLRAFGWIEARWMRNSPSDEAHRGERDA